MATRLIGAIPFRAWPITQNVHRMSTSKMLIVLLWSLRKLIVSVASLQKQLMEKIRRDAAG